MGRSFRRVNADRIYQWYWTFPYTNEPWKPNGELDEYGNAPFWSLS